MSDEPIQWGEDEDSCRYEVRTAFAADIVSLIVENIMTAHDRPMAALVELSFTLSTFPLDPKTYLEMDKSIIIP